ncbi:MAG TPA: PEP/pyruvate-binding domain-containing protein [Bacteroidales bacterium]|nr:hypothetical protein [Bacteroidales bacterium]MDI9573279.1 PEP/pyruvate-binding domain-containing protein [Bacteroidota bacterium]OQC60435.1 MAG: Pyruvate, phosphate dikinase [Bacteroidetes bacterium ADurb.Bin012]HNQ60437.1 PEP/pyruvate-binding domain-containing protein [Bacteroidales bacterium]HNU22545.1 PEP/pyruvate-binding domain-containing protein [Bacteroidales bacterium]
MFTYLQKDALPEKYSWFLSLSENYWGIHKRTQDFFEELKKPDHNSKKLIDLLTDVCISDFWIYKDLPDKHQVIQFIYEIFDSLLGENLSEENAKRLVYVFLDFFSKNYNSFGEKDKLVFEFIDILKKNYEKRSLSYLSNIGQFKKSLQKAAYNKTTSGPVIDFMRLLIKNNIVFWDTTTRIEEWYRNNSDKMSADYSDVIKSLGKDFFNDYYQKLNEADSWESLCELAFTFSDIIEEFRSKIENFNKATEQFSYIFYLLQCPGMAFHKDFLLMDLNRAIKRISKELNEDECIESIDKLFSLFSNFNKTHMSLILDSILALGKEIININNKKIIHYLEDRIIEFGFVSPGITYLDNDWELKVDPNHVKNTRVWLELIEFNPEMMKKLLSALIINLRIGGIFIYDSDLFQKDVSKLLNSKISPIYKQIKQLCRIFPVYYNEIGAEGLIREISTKIDEISYRNDKLIHFLRKQIHTEGNSSHVQITMEIIRFWYDLDKKRLGKIIPPNVLDTIEIKGKWVKGVHQVLRKISQFSGCTLDELLTKEQDDIEIFLSSINHDDKDDLERVALIFELYRLLKEKYRFETTKIIAVLKRYHFITNDDIESLEAHLNQNDPIGALKEIYSLMIKLNEIIFDPEISEGWESIFYKRHVAAGIPSMYGYYRETKFEALGLTFRLEKVASQLVSTIISEINTEYFTAKTLKKIYSILQLLREGLSLDGIYDQGFDSNLKIFQNSLTSESFTINQYINIFQFMEMNIKEIINKYFISPYESLLKIIIPQYVPQSNTMSADALNKLIIRKSEIFYRELLSSAFLIQYLDNFIGALLNNLRNLINNLSDTEIRSMLSYDPDMVISPLYHETPALDNQAFIGSKAYFLKKLYLNQYPVPPGFVLSTEVFRRVNLILKLPSLNSEIDQFIKTYVTELENMSGLKFGDTKKPLLLSVRSGAAISMPGAMLTLLNVGLNDEITESLSKCNNFGWTSWDCYRRLLQSWGMAHNLDRNDFDQIMLDYKQKYNVAQKIDFSPEMMREIAFAYKQLLIDNNIYFEEDPFLQLKKAIISVFYSWDTPRAKVYREYMHIAEEWGTAVIVQQMVFGNLHNESGSGVVFTHDVHDPSSGISLSGDFTFLSQGEDIVAGLVNTLPISEKQRKEFYHKSPFSLETKFPKIYCRLKEIAHELIEIHGFGHQELEFTFETSDPKDLYILQSRDMRVMKQNSVEVFATSAKKMQLVGCGIGIGNKVLNGVIVFDSHDLQVLKQESPHKNAILVRPDTVPDDIEMIFECEGLLTAKGGATSHAAVTAASLGKIGVVNCDSMIVFEKEKKCIINGNTFTSFDLIAIDGNKGLVYKGNYPIKIQEL